mgnify:FL=1
MKFIVSSSLLSQRLQTLGRVKKPTKNSMPILDNFLFEVQDNRLSLTSSDGEMTLRTVIDLVESDGPMAFTINSKTISEAVKAISDQPITFDLRPDTLELTINYLNGHFSLVAQSADEYPTFKDLEGEISTIPLEADKCFAGLQRAYFATADDPLRPVMNGIYFDQRPEGLSIVASDGRKLACTTYQTLTAEAPTSFILHKKPAELVRSIIQRETGDVVVRFTKRNASIQSENFLLTCRLIEGAFPNYNSVIPRNNPNLLTINRAALLDSLNRISVTANVGNPVVKLHVETGRLTISARDSDYGRSGEESLLCEYTGNPMSIGFKINFLLELIVNIEAEELIVQLADPSRAGIIVPSQQNENEEVLMLIMPAMLND